MRGKIAVVFVSSTKEEWFSLALMRYEKKIRSYTQLQIHQKGAIKDKDITLKVRKETEQIVKTIPSGYTRILLDPKGQELNSLTFSQRLQFYLDNPPQAVCFIVGGSHGICYKTLGQYRESWKVSSLELNHQVACLVLLEQIYRHFLIQMNHPYHQKEKG